MSTKTIKIAKEFSRAPGPRYTKLGPHSGERFRDELLIPALRNFDQVVVDLDGTFGYGSSFLEEAFGGLLRSGVSIDTASTIEFVSGEEPDLIDEIREYIESAARRCRDGERSP